MFDCWVLFSTQFHPLVGYMSLNLCELWSSRKINWIQTLLMTCSFFNIIMSTVAFVFNNSFIFLIKSMKGSFIWSTGLFIKKCQSCPRYIMKFISNATRIFENNAYIIKGMPRWVCPLFLKLPLDKFHGYGVAIVNLPASVSADNTDTKLKWRC